eukprot:sb/3479530/
MIYTYKTGCCYSTKKNKKANTLTTVLSRSEKGFENGSGQCSDRHPSSDDEDIPITSVCSVYRSLAHLNTTRDVCAAVSSMSHSIEVSFPKQGDCALLVLVKSIHFEWKSFPNGQTASMDRLRSMATQISQISTRKNQLNWTTARDTVSCFLKLHTPSENHVSQLPMRYAYQDRYSRATLQSYSTPPYRELWFRGGVGIFLPQTVSLVLHKLLQRSKLSVLSLLSRYHDVQLDQPLNQLYVVPLQVGLPNVSAKEDNPHFQLVRDSALPPLASQSSHNSCYLWRKKQLVRSPPHEFKLKDGVGADESIYIVIRSGRNSRSNRGVVLTQIGTSYSSYQDRNICQRVNGVDIPLDSKTALTICELNNFHLLNSSGYLGSEYEWRWARGIASIMANLTCEGRKCSHVNIDETDCDGPQYYTTLSCGCYPGYEPNGSGCEKCDWDLFSDGQQYPDCTYCPTYSDSIKSSSGRWGYDGCKCWNSEEFWHRGNNSCTACPIGEYRNLTSSYNYNYTSYTCLPCPHGQTTLNPGAMNVSACVQAPSCGDDGDIHFLSLVCIRKTFVITFGVVAGLLAATCLLCGCIKSSRRKERHNTERTQQVRTPPQQARTPPQQARTPGPQQERTPPPQARHDTDSSGQLSHVISGVSGRTEQDGNHRGEIRVPAGGEVYVNPIQPHTGNLHPAPSAPPMDSPGQPPMGSPWQPPVGSPSSPWQGPYPASGVEGIQMTSLNPRVELDGDHAAAPPPSYHQHPIQDGIPILSPITLNGWIVRVLFQPPSQQDLEHIQCQCDGRDLRHHCTCQSIGLTRFSRELWSEHWPDSTALVVEPLTNRGQFAVVGTYKHTTIEIDAKDLKYTSPNLTQIAKRGVMNLGRTTKLALCFAGIFACYFYYGVIQEKITRGSYGLDKERYLYTVFLVFCQCVINAAFAKGMLLVTSDGTPSKTPNKLSFLCGCTYVGAMLASNASLKWVNYPTQVLGKSCKPITVMILGVRFKGKRYNLAKYLAVLMIVCGVALFMFKDGKSSANETVFGVGEFLLLVSLTLGNLQNLVFLCAPHNVKED